MPTVPSLPPQLMGAPSQGPNPGPANLLMAAADLHSQGEFQSAPVPTGHPLQTGKKPSRRAKLEVVK